MNKSKETNIVKIIELIAGSSIILGALGYFSGYIIMSSFLKNLFNLPFITGIFFPPIHLIFLGYMLIFSLILAIPLARDLSIKRGFQDVWELIPVVVLILLLDRTQGFHIGKLWVSPMITTICIFLIYIITWTILYMRIKKGIAHKKDKLQKFLYYFPPSTIFILLAILLPIISDAHNRAVINDISIPTFVLSFYIEYIYTLTCLTAATTIAFTAIKSALNTKDKIIYSFNLIVVYILFIYNFSGIIGNSIANTYKKNERGLFPITSVILNQEILYHGKQTSRIDGIRLLSKDQDSYFLFNVNPNDFIILSKDKISYLYINK